MVAPSRDRTTGVGVRTYPIGGATLTLHDHATPPEDADRFGFEDSEGLRALLIRLHHAGREAWRHDPEVEALMRFAIDRYAALARKHGQEPEDAAVAAFEAMRTPSIRRADDPWAVVTHAVQITLGAEEKATGMLCSTHQARRSQYSGFHDAERFSDRETPISDYHPAFHIHPHHERGDDRPSVDSPEPCTSATSAVEDTVGLFTLLGWPPETARAGIDYICARLTESGDRARAFEFLRRDKHPPALLDIDHHAWLTMLRVVLGNPHPDHAHTATGRGVLVRLLIGQSLAQLLADDEIVLTISLMAPTPPPRAGEPGG